MNQAMAGDPTASRKAGNTRDSDDECHFTDSDGNKFVAMPNAGRDICGFLTLLAHWMLSVGIPYDSVLAAVNGTPTKELQDRVQKLREDVVRASNVEQHFIARFEYGVKETLSLEQLLRGQDIIQTKKMWDAVHLHPNGHADAMGLVLGASLLQLRDFKIVHAGNDGRLVTADGCSSSTAGSTMALHHRWGQIEAIVPPPVSLL